MLIQRVSAHLVLLSAVARSNSWTSFFDDSRPETHTLPRGPNNCYIGYGVMSTCYACPASFYAGKDCPKDHTATEHSLAGGCGFLKAGCRAWCRWDGPTKKDEGCGCDKGTSCLVQDCVQSDWGEWSACSEACNPNAPIKYGTQSAYRTTLTEAAHGGKECGHSGIERQCDSHNCRVDCKVGPWTNWGSCDRSCGGGKQYRIRTITQQPRNGGNSCPALQEERACNSDACYWLSLQGRSKSEQVKVIEGGKLTSYTLNSKKTIGVNERQVTVQFLNDASNRDVYFQFATAPNSHRSSGSVDRPGWNCHTSNPNSRCSKLGNSPSGQYNFLWNGDYTIQFDYHVQGDSFACEESIRPGKDIVSGQFERIGFHTSIATDWDCKHLCRTTSGCRYWVRQPSTGKCWLGKGENKAVKTTNDRNMGFACPHEDLKNAGKNCWSSCAPGGHCDWCGRGNLCCRKNWASDPAACGAVTDWPVDYMHTCVQGPSPTAPTPAPGCSWGQPISNVYLGSYAAGHSHQYGALEAAKAKCEELGGACAGVTKSGSGNIFTVRGNPGTRPSPYGETSWEKGACGGR